MTLARSLFVSAATLMLALSVSAHHSGAMFDQSKQQTLTGTVKEFQWTNPHSWIQLLVSTDNGTEEWSIEMAGPPALYRDGWRPSTLKQGDKVEVVINPTRDGSKGGNFISGIGPDGKPLGKK